MRVGRHDEVTEKDYWKTVLKLGIEYKLKWPRKWREWRRALQAEGTVHGKTHMYKRTRHNQGTATSSFCLEGARSKH